MGNCIGTSDRAPAEGRGHPPQAGKAGLAPGYDAGPQQEQYSGNALPRKELPAGSGKAATKELVGLAKLSGALDLTASPPCTPQPGDTIPAGHPPSAGSSTRQGERPRGQRRPGSAPPPSPVSKAPSGVVMASPPEAPYAAPFVPAPSVPPPESPGGDRDEEDAPSWQPCRKRALIVGVTYAACTEPGAGLQGCVNDAHCLLHLLTTKFGFQASSVILLHDKQPHPEYLPTKDNILEGLRWLTAGAQPGDSLFFGFSGHGVPAAAEGAPDVLLPCDFREARARAFFPALTCRCLSQGGSLTGEELMGAGLGALPPGCKAHCVVDPCQGLLAPPLGAQVVARADGWASWEDDDSRPVTPVRGAPQGPQGGEVLWFTSSLPTPHDLDPEAQAVGSFASTGASTFALIQAVEKGQAATYNMLLRAMRYALKNGPNHFAAALAEARTPLLLSTHAFDLNRPFIM